MFLLASSMGWSHVYTDGSMTNELPTHNKGLTICQGWTELSTTSISIAHNNFSFTFDWYMYMYMLFQFSSTSDDFNKYNVYYKALIHRLNDKKHPFSIWKNICYSPSESDLMKKMFQNVPYVQFNLRKILNNFRDTRFLTEKKVTIAWTSCKVHGSWQWAHLFFVGIA